MLYFFLWQRRDKNTECAHTNIYWLSHRHSWWKSFKSKVYNALSQFYNFNFIFFRSIRPYNTKPSFAHVFSRMSRPFAAGNVYKGKGGAWFVNIQTCWLVSLGEFFYLQYRGQYYIGSEGTCSQVLRSDSTDVQPFVRIIIFRFLKL